jgi:hypothetical protein
VKDSIHNTMEGRDGKTYVVVSLKWKRMMTYLNIVGLLCGMAICYWVWANQSAIEEVKHLTEKAKLRAKAQAEVTRSRAEIQVFSYNKACAYAKSKGEECLLYPKWWAKREDYPLIANDPYFGDGLFGPEESK